MQKSSKTMTVDEIWRLLKNKEVTMAKTHFESFLKTNARNKDSANFKSALAGLARCYHELGQYQSCEATYKRIKEWEYDDIALLGLARCAQQEKRYDVAVSYYKRIRGITRKPKALISLARCYQCMGQDLNEIAWFELAEETYKSAFGWENDRDVLLGLAYLYIEMNHTEVERVFQKIPNWRNDKEASLGLARYYQDQGEHQKSKAIFDSMLQKWPNDKLVLLGLACFYEVTHQVQNAENTFKQIRGWRLDKTVIICMSHFYARIHRYQEANEHLRLISQWNSNPDVLLALAFIYQNQGKLQEAVDIFRQIPNYANNKEVILGIARCLQAMHKYEQAIKEFECLIARWPNDHLSLLGEARCFEEMGVYQSAENKYKAMLIKWPNDAAIVLSLARCYQEMGNYQKAEKTYCDALVRLPNHKMLLLSLARCYEEVGRMEEAEATFKRIPKWESDREALLGLAYLYCEQEDIKAEDLFKSIGKDKSALLGLGIYYEKVKHFAEAEATFNEIEGGLHDKDVLASLGRLYEKMNRFELAERTFKQISHWENDESALLNLAFLYTYRRKLRDAEIYYQMLLAKFPYSLKVKVSFANYLVCYGNPHEAQTFLTDALQKMPFASLLYLVKADLQNKSGQYNQALATLIQTVNLFPYFSNAYLALIKQYLFLGDLFHAEQYRNESMLRFVGHLKLENRLEQMMRTYVFIQDWGVDCVEAQNPISQKCLTDTIPEEIIQALKEIPGRYYFIGGAVLTLLEGRPLLPHQDIDIVARVTGVDSLYKKSDFISSLYTRKINEILIEAYFTLIDERVADCDDLIQSNFFSRDFTICCLYCDKDGNVFDPTGSGVDDFRNKILRTVKPAKLCFEEDPTRILRALKYIQIGYTPTEDLLLALQEFVMPWDWKKESFNEGHLFAVTRKLLHTMGEGSLISQLNRYCLLNKLYGIETLDSEETQELKLRQLVFNHPPQKALSAIQQPEYPPSKKPSYAKILESQGLLKNKESGNEESHSALSINKVFN